ncbi:MAG: hypothetical protein IJB62_04145 [Alistipes sp.]|nr:hypothetical protein [Alistipes sp.]
METILKCRFMRTLLRGQKHDYDPSYLLASFQDFKSLLLTISDDAHNYRKKFRTLKSLRGLLEIHIQSDKFRNERGENIQAFTTLALKQVSVELDLLEKQLQYPDLFTLTDKLSHPTSSSLVWNTKTYTKRDLIELITALTDAGAILSPNGNSIAFSTAVKEFASFLNITISTSQAYNERDNIKSIKQNPASFTEKLVCIQKGTH